MKVNSISYNIMLCCPYRFGNGFGADARRKRHTADSGYGSEQPLDRRWSQDFSQDVSKYIRNSKIYLAEKMSDPYLDFYDPFFIYN